MNAPQPPQAPQPLLDARMLCTDFACPDHAVPGPGGQAVIPLAFGAGPAKVTVIVPAENAAAIADAIKRAAIAAPASAIETAGSMQDAMEALRRGGD